MIHRLFVLAVMLASACTALAQGTAAVQGNKPMEPWRRSKPVEPCMKDFLPLFSEATKTRGLIKFSAPRHTSPAESCKLIKDYREAVLKMRNYAEANAAKCETLSKFAPLLRADHEKVETEQKRVCTLAAKWPDGLPWVGDDGDPVLFPLR